MAAPLLNLPQTITDLPNWLFEGVAANEPFTASQLSKLRWHMTDEVTSGTVAKGAAGTFSEYSLIGQAVGMVALMGLTGYIYVADQRKYDSKHFTPCGSEPRHTKNPLGNTVTAKIRAQTAITAMDPDTKKRLIAYASRHFSTEAAPKNNVCDKTVTELAELQAQLVTLRDQLRTATIMKDGPLRTTLFRQIEALEMRQQILLLDGTYVCNQDFLTPEERFAKDHPIQSVVGNFLRGGFTLIKRLAVPVATVGIIGGGAGYYFVKPLVEEALKVKAATAERDSKAAAAVAEKAERRAKNHFVVRASLEQYGVEHLKNSGPNSIGALINKYMDHFLNAESKNELMENVKSLRAEMLTINMGTYGYTLADPFTVLVGIVADNNLGDEFMPILKECFVATQQLDTIYHITNKLVPTYTSNGVISNPESYARFKVLAQQLNR